MARKDAQMAGKGYRPALFELVRKGPLKPNQKGTLTTPKWFYKRKSEETVEPLRRETGQESIQQEDIPAVQEDDLSSSSMTESPERPESVIGLHLAGKKLAFWAPYWAIGLVFMGLFLCFLVVFWLGQVSVRGTATSPERQMVAEAGLDEIQQGSVRPEVLDLSANLPGNVGSPPAAKQTVSNVTVSNTNLTNGQDDQVVKGRNCLALCSHSNRRELGSVQEYFSKKGVLTKIGRFSGSYIVYCEEGTDRPSGYEAVNLRNRMIEIGKLYNKEKPSGAASFLPSTFESAYWVVRERIN